MTDIECLLAIEEIKNLKARYFRCMDTKGWTGFQAVFAADATADFTREGGDRGARRSTASAITTRPTRKSTAVGSSRR